MSNKLEFRFKAGKQSISGRVYPVEELEKAIRFLSIVPGSFYDLDVSNPSDVLDENGVPKTTLISHLVENIRLEGDEIVGDIRILDTTQGKILKKLIENEAGTYGFYPSGVGRVRTDDQTVYDFEIGSVNCLIDTRRGEYPGYDIVNGTD